MSHYVILADHSPDIFPSSNCRSRERAIQETGQELPEALRRGGHHLPQRPAPPPSGHRTVAVVDAPSIEAATELVYATGLSQWNNVEVCPTTPVADMVANLSVFPIVFE